VAAEGSKAAGRVVVSGLPPLAHFPALS